MLVLPNKIVAYIKELKYPRYQKFFFLMKILKRGLDIKKLLKKRT